MSAWNVPGYQETGPLGSGATGKVVAAVHRASGTPVAIKYLSQRLRHEPQFLDRFRIEARILAGLSSPYVVKYHDYVETDTDAALVMELVDGVTLRTVLKETGPLVPEAALLLMRGSLLGLAAAHEVGIVHRDYKPANVLIDAAGGSKLADFGIADRHGADMPATGTPSYMAPEQWEGAPAHPVADIYATTIVLFECLTGRVPYSAETLYELQAMHQTAPIPVQEVPPELQPLVAHGLAKEVGYRPADAAAFVAELEQVAGAAYGEEWEERGRRALILIIGTLAALLPLALLDGAIGSGGAGSGGGASASGTTSIGGGAGGATTTVGRGFVFRRVGGKAAQAKAGVIAAMVAVIGVVAVIAAVIAMGTGTPPTKNVGGAAPGLDGSSTGTAGGGGGGSASGSDATTSDSAAAAATGPATTPSGTGTPSVTAGGSTATGTSHPTGPVSTHTFATPPSSGPIGLTSAPSLGTAPPTGPTMNTTAPTTAATTTTSVVPTTTVPTTTTTTQGITYKVSVIVRPINSTYVGLCPPPTTATTFQGYISISGTLSAPITVTFHWRTSNGGDSDPSTMTQTVSAVGTTPITAQHHEYFYDPQKPITDWVAVDWSSPGLSGQSNHVPISITCTLG